MTHTNLTVLWLTHSLHIVTVIYCGVYCCRLFQLTVDFAWSPACVDKRCYDYTSLADIADFVFIMSYDERSQVLGPCVAWANSALNTTLSGTFAFICIMLHSYLIGLCYEIFRNHLQES